MQTASSPAGESVPVPQLAPTDLALALAEIYGDGDLRLGTERVAGRIAGHLAARHAGVEFRVLIVDGDRLRAFAPAGDDTVVECGSVLWGPVTSAWVVGDDALPAAIGSALGLPEPPLGRRALVGADGCEGALVWSRSNEDARWEEDLPAVLAHAARAVRIDRLERRLEQEAQTDGLTGVANYRLLLRTIAQEIDRCAREGGRFAIVMLDVDNLKYYNDRFGHLGGSAALREIAELLRRRTRSIDLVAKYGGDEFCVLLQGADWQRAAAFAERIRSAVEAHPFESDGGRRLTVSMGITAHPDEGHDPRDLLRRADERLYEAKAAGRNRIGTRS